MASGQQAYRETAYAKINLALHVRERLPDGYHRIETLFAFCEDGDVLEAEPAEELSLTIDGPFADGLSNRSDNLVMRAAGRLRDVCAPTSGAAMRLTKNLPVASGIGGGSADAAAALRMLARLWQVSQDDPVLFDVAKNLGADVPACLLSRACRGDGRGDDLAAIGLDAFDAAPVLLINPGVAVPTGPVFGAWDGVDRGGLSIADPLVFDPGWRNDLAEPAMVATPAVGDVLEALETSAGADFVRMSGSGATCFALFDTIENRDGAAVSLAENSPQWWTMQTSLR